MTKIRSLVVFFILISNVIVQGTSVVVDGNEDIMAALARLHQEADRIRRHLNPVPDLLTFVSNDVAARMKRYVNTKQAEEDSDTVYVNLKIDSEEDLETKYVNLYIDTNRDLNGRSSRLHQPANSINTNVAYFNRDSLLNNRPYLSYRRYQRRRQNN